MDKLLRHIGSPKKLLEWKAFYELEPRGAEWDRELFGTIAATQVNLNRSPNSKAFDWKFFYAPRHGFIGETAEDISKRWKKYMPPEMNPDLDEIRLKAWCFQAGGKPAKPKKEK